MYNSNELKVTIKSIVSELNSSQTRINLNPTYQRKVVWDEELGQYFIESICKGIISHHISLNKISDKQANCIDGKQRLTSLQKYYNNEFKAVIKKRQKYYKDLSPTEQEKIDNRCIRVVYYENLNFDGEKDVFLAIQSSMPLVHSEKLVALIKNRKYTDKFIKYRESLQPKLSKFKYSEKSRYGINTVLSELLLFHNEGLKNPNRKQMKNYIKKLDINSNIDEIKKYVEPLLSTNILNHPDVHKGIKINVIYVFIYKVSLKFDSYNFESSIAKKLRKIINELHNKCEMNKISLSKTDNNFSKISDIFDIVYNKHIKLCEKCYKLTCICEVCPNCNEHECDCVQCPNCNEYECECEYCLICNEYDCDCDSEYCGICDSCDCICEDDIFKNFIFDMYTITKNKHNKQKLQIIYDNMRCYYKEYEDEEPLTKRALTQRLRDEGCSIKKFNNTIWYVTNIKLKED